MTQDTAACLASAQGSRLVVWRLNDGKPGHQKQSFGLVQGLSALLPVDVHNMDVRGHGPFWRRLLGFRANGGLGIPTPDVIVGVGHRTHLPLLVARVLYGGRTVVLMKPTLPHCLFDLLFVPQHDRCRPRRNVVTTRGVICPTLETAKSPRRGLILLGGTSRHFDWPINHIAAQVAGIAQASRDVQWQVCDSRRTPDGLRAALPAAPNLCYRSWRSAPDGFLDAALAEANYVWVTADSASMLYEALSAGAQVGVITLPRKSRRRGNKHVRGIEALLAQGHVISSAAGLRLEDRKGTPRFQPENRRCAQIVVERLVASRWGSSD